MTGMDEAKIARQFEALAPVSRASRMAAWREGAAPRNLRFVLRMLTCAGWTLVACFQTLRAARSEEW